MIYTLPVAQYFLLSYYFLPYHCHVIFLLFPLCSPMFFLQNLVLHIPFRDVYQASITEAIFELTQAEVIFDLTQVLTTIIPSHPHCKIRFVLVSWLYIPIFSQNASLLGLFGACFISINLEQQSQVKTHSFPEGWLNHQPEYSKYLKCI